MAAGLPRRRRLTGTVGAASRDSSPRDGLDVVAEAARLLVANGHTTAGTTTATESLARALGLHVTVVVDWSAVTVVDRDGVPARCVAVSPTGVQLRVVGAVLDAIAWARRESARSAAAPRDLACGVAERLADAERRPASSTWLFVVACVTGAVALALIFGATRLVDLALIALAAATGGLVRRGMARWGVGVAGQAFAAALIAGLAGAASIAIDASSAARLVAVCPAMVLVPGPHLLNGTLDVFARRMSVGLGRLAHGGLVLLAIGAGIVVGLAPAGTLPATATTGAVALPIDVAAAMVAAASYPVYFSLELRRVLWPVLAGGVAHAAHWVVVTALDGGVVLGGFVACLVAGLLLVPVAEWLGISFAGVGFAAVVALVPGVYAFRALAGLVALAGEGADGAAASTASAVAADLATTGLTLLAMAVGLALAASMWRRTATRRAARIAARSPS